MLPLIPTAGGRRHYLMAISESVAGSQLEVSQSPSLRDQQRRAAARLDQKPARIVTGIVFIDSNSEIPAQRCPGWAGITTIPIQD